jgi:vacuolar-type H+-ATPase subunit F/Vma7
MSRIVALGERRRLEGFTLAGVELIRADDPQAARTAWTGLASDVAVVILTPASHDAIPDLLPLRPDVIWTTLPD